MENPPPRTTPDPDPAQGGNRPDQDARRRPAAASRALLDEAWMNVHEYVFDPEEVEVIEDVLLSWRAGGSSGEVSTATDADPPVAIALFGGDSNVYTIEENGTLESVPGSIQEGWYNIYKGSTIGGTVRGRINVKRTF